MDIKIKREIEYSIVVVENELRALVNFLSSNYSNILITVSCNDGSSLTTKDIEDIINFENSNFRKFESLKLDFGERNSQGGDVEFSDGFLLSTCSFTVVETDDSKALKVAKEIEQRLEECKTWYSNLGKYLLFVCILFAVLFMWSTIVLLSEFVNSFNGKVSAAISTLMVLLGIVGIVVLGFVIGIYLTSIWSWMFPRIWFDIGKQKIELQKRIKVRGWVFGGVIGTLVLGIIASVIATFITNGLTR